MRILNTEKAFVFGISGTGFAFIRVIRGLMILATLALFGANTKSPERISAFQLSAGSTERLDDDELQPGRFQQPSLYANCGSAWQKKKLKAEKRLMKETRRHLVGLGGTVKLAGFGGN